MIKFSRTLKISKSEYNLFTSSVDKSYYISNNRFEKVTKNTFVCEKHNGKLKFNYDKKTEVLSYNYQATEKISDDRLYLEDNLIRNDIKKMFENEITKKFTKSRFIVIFSLIIIVLLMGYISLSLIFTDIEKSLNNFWNIFGSDFNTWTLVNIFNIWIIFAIESIVFCLFLRTFAGVRNVNFFRVWFTFAIFYFLNSITPFRGIGFAWLIWDISRCTPGVSKSIIFNSFISLWIFINIFVILYSVFFAVPYVNIFLETNAISIEPGNYTTTKTLFVFGIVFQFSFIFLIYVLSTSKHIQTLILKGVILVLEFLRLDHKVPGVTDKILLQSYKSQKILKRTFRTWSTYFYSIILFVSLKFWVSFNTFALYSSSAYPLNFNYFDLLVIDHIIWLSIEYIPIPGKVGLSEWVNLTLTSEYIKFMNPLFEDYNSTAELFVLTKRSLSFYMPNLLLGIVYILYILKLGFIKNINNKGDILLNEDDISKLEKRGKF